MLPTSASTAAATAQPTSAADLASTAAPTAQPARLNPDLYDLIVGSHLQSADTLSCACVCSALRHLCEAHLPRVNVRGSAISGAQLLWLTKVRLTGACESLDVSDCEHLTKAHVAAAVAASPKLRALTALRVGPGSWSAKHLAKLISASPSTLASARLDVRAELKNDLHVDSPLLAALVNVAVRAERLTLIADNVSQGPSPAGTHGDATGDGPAAAAAAAAATGTATGRAASTRSPTLAQGYCRSHPARSSLGVALSNVRLFLSHGAANFAGWG